MSDEYLEDAKKLIGMCSRHISEEMDEDGAIQGALFLALGMEKLLKHLLVKINPIFILKSSDFKHSAAALYSHLFCSDGEGEVAKQPDTDVLTFRSSLTRARVFSAAANTNSQLLYSLAGWRDVIVHRPTSEVDKAVLARMLKKDAVELLSSFATELNLDLSDFLGLETSRLVDLSKKLSDQVKFEERMEELLTSHRVLWEHRKKTNQLIFEQATAITRNLLKQTGPDFMYDEVSCPACGNTATVRIEPDYDSADGESYLAGVYVQELSCFFCSLRLQSYEELSFFGVNDLLS
jgi:hypothetical protein